MMRFGRVIWSETGEIINKKIIIVENIYDEKNSQKHHLFDPEWSNIQRELLLQKAINKELIDLLLLKGILSQSEVGEVVDNANIKYKDYYKDFAKVDDVDEYSE